jgi:hypothetical protein
MTVFPSPSSPFMGRNALPDLYTQTPFRFPHTIYKDSIYMVVIMGE